MRNDADHGRTAGLLLLVALIALPIAWAAGYSLAYGLGGIGLLSDGWTLRHWRSAFAAGGLKESFAYSAAVAAAVTGIATIVSLGLVLLAPQTRRSGFVLAVASVPLATPGAVLALMTYQILNPGGFLARLAFRVGLIDSPSEFPALVNDPYSVGILVAQVSGAVPLLTLFFLKTWTAARADAYCRLATSLGASLIQARLRVALPMLLTRGRPLVVLLFLVNLGSYEVPLLLGRQFPQMFSVLTQRQFGRFDLLERPQAFVLATAYLVSVGTGVWVFLRWRRRHE